MGSGKTTIGRALARLLNRPFCDLDREIEQLYSKSISTIFETEGEDAFREKEKKVLHAILDRKEPHVIALGGGTVCFYDSIQKIKTSGFLVFLQTTPEILFERITKQQANRPLLMGLSGDPLLQFIKTKLQERAPWYSQAHLSITNSDAGAETLHQLILAANA